MSFLSEFDRKKVFKTSKYNEIRAKEGKSVKKNCSDYSLSITWKTDCDNVYPMFKQHGVVGMRYIIAGAIKNSTWGDAEDRLTWTMIDDIVNWR